MHNTPTSIAFTTEDLEYNRRGETQLAAPPLAAPTDAAARLGGLEDLRARGLVTASEYAERRAEILASL